MKFVLPATYFYESFDIVFSNAVKYENGMQVTHYVIARRIYCAFNKILFYKTHIWHVYLIFQNLDALHDHLGTLYPGMRAPSFRCTERPEDGALVLHYYSDRPGLEHIVIGIVKVIL